MKIDNNILDELSCLEKEFDVVKLFKYQNTTSWINIKDYLYSKSLNNVVKSATTNSKSFINKNGFVLFLLSLKHYFKIILKREEVILYVGAGSGLFDHNGQVFDSYIPKELENENVLYLLSAEYPDKLIQYKDYIKNHNIIIYSFLLAPLKSVLTKIILRINKIKIDNSFLDELEKKNYLFNKQELEYIHARFIVSYYLYKFLLANLKIKKAYVVSAYSNTELISVLKEKDIEIIELQHGIIGSVHRGYNYAIKDKLLPTPNKVYVYDKFWKQELLNAGYYEEKQIKVTGRLKYELVNRELSLYNNQYIVFTGQGGFYREIVELFNNAIEYLSNKNIKLIYIPHPNESQADILYLKDRLENDNIIILSKKDYSTEQYIYSSLAHISVYSSCHFDAIYYKNKTFVYDVMNNNPMQYYLTHFQNSFQAIKNIREIEL